MVSQRGRPPRSRLRRFRFCPKCGTDLEKLHPIRVGDLYADPIGDTFWKGVEVKLTSTERVILNTLLTCEQMRWKRTDSGAGFYVSKEVVAERTDLGVDSLVVVMSRLRSKFVAVDSDFDNIETELKLGWRWSQVRIKKPVARFKSGMILYDDGTLLWMNRYTLELTERERIIMKTLMRARGEYVSTFDLREAVGISENSALYTLLNGLKAKFKIAGPEYVAVVGRRGMGYKLVIPTDEEELRRRRVYEEKRVGSGSTGTLMSEDKVRELRRRRKKGELVKDLAEEFGLAKSSCYGILSHRLWKHVT